MLTSPPAILLCEIPSRRTVSSGDSDDVKRHSSELVAAVFRDDEQSRVHAGVVTRGALRQLADSLTRGQTTTLAELSKATPAVAYPDEPLRVVAHRMAETGLTRFPVVERGDVPRLVGMISLEHLLSARVRYLDAERRRERVMKVKVAFPFRLGRGET